MKCKQLNKYFCVVGTNDTGTYLYYISSIVDGTTANTNTTTMTRKKIADGKINIIGMAYIQNLYIVIETNANGETKVWQSSNLKLDNDRYSLLALENDFTATAMTFDDSYIYVVSGNTEQSQINITKIDMNIDVLY